MAYPARIWDIPPPPGAEEYQPTPMPPAPTHPPVYMNPGYYTGHINYNPGVFYPANDRFNSPAPPGTTTERYLRKSPSPRRSTRFSRRTPSPPRRYKRSRSRHRSRSRSRPRYHRHDSRSSKRRHHRSRSRSRKSRSRSRYSSRHRRQTSSSSSSRSSKSPTKSPSPFEETQTTTEETRSQHRGLDRKSHKEFIKTKAQEYTNKRNSSTDSDAANSFKNDGSFLEMFKKLQEEKVKKVQEPVVSEEVENPEKILNIVAAASTLLEPTKPPILPVVAKRRGGRALKTGMVEKKRFVVQEEQPKDAWAVYMKEVKRYKEACCDDDSKTRPLVK